jgi:hypothetical protein
VSGFYDVYVLAPARTADAVDRFLARFAPERQESGSEYAVPQYADAPAHVFQRDGDLVRYCVAHPHEPHGLYWQCLGAADPAHAIAFFTADGALILGLSVMADAERWLAELRAFTGSEAGCVLFEVPPPNTATAFRALAASSA